jgi:hypothetical protein
MRDLNREVHLEKFRQKKEFLKDWNEQQIKNWKNTIEKQANREAGEVNFEKNKIIREQRKLRKIREFTSTEVKESLCSFDETLQSSTLETGGEDDKDPLVLLSKTTKVESQSQLLLSLEQKLTDSVLNNEEFSGIFEKIHASNMSGNVQRCVLRCKTFVVKKIHC